MGSGRCREVQRRGQMSRRRPSSCGGWGDLALGWALGRTAWTSRARLLGGTGRWTPTQHVATLPLVFLTPVPVTASTMLPPRTALFLTLVLAAGFLGLRARRPTQPPSPISAIQPKADFKAQQVERAAVGRQRGGSGSPSSTGVRPGQPHPLVPSYSRPPVCRNLVPGRRGLLVSLPAGAGPPGRGHRTARGSPGHIHGRQHLPKVGWHLLARAAALQKHRGPRPLPAPSSRRQGGGAGGCGGDGLQQLRHPVLGARTAAVGEAVRLVVDMFEQRVQQANLTEDHILYFPKYGFCETADQFHILDEVAGRGQQ